MNCEPTIAALRRVHIEAMTRFPHEYLDSGLGAVGLFLHETPKNAGYSQTPTNSVTFASLGVDGIHLGSVTNGTVVDPTAPVVVTVPMELETPNFIVGESLYDFLCFGLYAGYGGLANLHIDIDGTLGRIAMPSLDEFDERVPKILDLLANEFALQPWGNAAARFADLQRRFMQSLQLPS